MSVAVMRFRLRTLLILLAVAPVVLAAAFWDRGIAVGLLAGLALVVPVFVFAAIIEFMEERRTRRQ